MGCLRRGWHVIPMPRLKCKRDLDARKLNTGSYTTCFEYLSSSFATHKHYDTQVDLIEYLYYSISRSLGYVRSRIRVVIGYDLSVDLGQIFLQHIRYL